MGHAPGHSASSLQAEARRTHNAPEEDAVFLRPDAGLTRVGEVVGRYYCGARVGPPDTTPLGIERPDGREVDAGDSGPLHRGV